MPARSAPHSRDLPRLPERPDLLKPALLRRLPHIFGGGSYTIRADPPDHSSLHLRVQSAPRAGAAGDTTAAWGFCADYAAP